MPKSTRSQRSKKPYNSFGNTPTENHKKIDHFGEIPIIPRKVVEVVQLDVVESYGRMNDGSLYYCGSAPSSYEKNPESRVIAATKTTLFED